MRFKSCDSKDTLGINRLPFGWRFCIDFFNCTAIRLIFVLLAAELWRFQACNGGNHGIRDLRFFAGKGCKVGWVWSSLMEQSTLTLTRDAAFLGSAGSLKVRVKMFVHYPKDPAVLNALQRHKYSGSLCRSVLTTPAIFSTP